MGRLGRHRGRDLGPRALPKTIAALSRALPGGLSPEILRKAKFDLPEAAAELWSLLFSLLWLVHQEDPGVPRQPPDALEGQIRFVKWVLYCHGYGRRHFYQIPEVDSHGSCELLLAFSWLLAYLSLPERFLCLNCTHRGDAVWICSCKDLTSYPVPLALGPKGRVDIRYIHWLLGKLRFHWRNLHASQQEQCILLNKLLLQLESENSCLEAFLEWKHMELVYWQWMETVLDVSPVGIPNTIKQDVFLPEILEYCNPTYITGEVDRVQKNLVALRQRLEEAVNQQRAAWYTKVRKCKSLPRLPELSTARKKEIQEAVECELVALEQDYFKTWSHRLQRLVFRKAEEPGNNGTYQMTKIIQVLKKEETSLEKTLRRLQKECQEELAILAHEVDGVIWIPPPYPRQ
ncbi:tubulin epsilon and delta complex protein 1 isoform X2 [Macrotis lagotis]|uniref:tubulin epsilon and delta complex protein 1 isoform X2 n=1 Tax=Macrotis lagotis TaxID=92651 RepID=UPI003D69EA89